MSERAVTGLDLPLVRVASGKVREVFELDRDRLLFVATDRISAFDVVMSQGIPDKGRVLTSMSHFWFDLVKDVCPNHLIPGEDGLPDALAGRRELEGRFMIVRRLSMLPIEFVVRGYLAGSAYSEYVANGSVCGIGLPPGLAESAKLPEPIFTPATKATSGHDVNISEDMAADAVGAGVLKTAKGFALDLYSQAAAYAEKRGIILADTKFEFGLDDGEVTVADEVLTPDSSRFWPSDEWAPGQAPPSFDKQYLRDWLSSVGWNREPPPPDLPAEVIQNTRARYVEAHERLIGEFVWGGSGG